MSTDVVSAAVVGASVAAFCAVGIFRGLWVWESRKTVQRAKDSARLWRHAAEAAERRRARLQGILDANNRRLATAWNDGDPVARCAEAIRLVDQARYWIPCILDRVGVGRNPPGVELATNYREGDVTFAGWNVSTWLRDADRVAGAGPGPYPRIGLDEGAQREGVRT